MDEYGQCTIDDAEMLAYELKNHGSLMFTYVYGSHTQVIGIHRSPPVVGTIGFGGYPRGYVVGSVYAGYFHFDLKPGAFFSGRYIAEKLCMGEEYGGAVAELLNEISKYMGDIEI